MRGLIVASSIETPIDNGTYPTTPFT